METGLSSGLFQIEGDLAAQTCAKVKPTTFEHLSAVLALARPGAMDYIDRYAEYVNEKVINQRCPSCNKSQFSRL